MKCLYYLFANNEEFKNLECKNFLINLDVETEIHLSKGVLEGSEQPDYALVLDLSKINFKTFKLKVLENSLFCTGFISNSPETLLKTLDFKPLIKEIIPKNSRKLKFNELGTSFRTSLEANTEKILINQPRNIILLLK